MSRHDSKQTNDQTKEPQMNDSKNQITLMAERAEQEAKEAAERQAAAERKAAEDAARRQEEEAKAAQDAADRRLRAAAPMMLDALRGVMAIVGDSRGVAGYHLNGDIAEWDSFHEIGAVHAAISAAIEGGAA